MEGRFFIYGEKLEDAWDQLLGQIYALCIGKTGDETCELFDFTRKPFQRFITDDFYILGSVCCFK